MAKLVEIGDADFFFVFRFVAEPDVFQEQNDMRGELAVGEVSFGERISNK